MANGTWEAPERGWTLAGTSTGIAEEVSYPASARELFLIAVGAGLAYSSVIPLDALPSGIDHFAIGAYCYNANNTGNCIVQHKAAQRKVDLWEFKYLTVTSGTLYVYYR